jgi:hypothetical protein
LSFADAVCHNCLLFVFVRLCTRWRGARPLGGLSSRFFVVVRFGTWDLSRKVRLRFQLPFFCFQISPRAALFRFHPACSSESRSKSNGVTCGLAWLHMRTPLMCCVQCAGCAVAARAPGLSLSHTHTSRSHYSHEQHGSHEDPSSALSLCPCAVARSACRRFRTRRAVSTARVSVSHTTVHMGRLSRARRLSPRTAHHGARPCALRAQVANPDRTHAARAATARAAASAASSSTMRSCCAVMRSCCAVMRSCCAV